MKFLVKFFTHYQSAKNWQKVVIAVFGLFFLSLFLQNFLFSNSFCFLHLREIDDVAFQYSIRAIHQNISHFKIDRLINLNDYGYGWIFWILIGFVTYPFYLLALVTDSYHSLIILPREISLFFTMGTVFLVYKILSIYTRDEFIKFCSLIFLISFPAIGDFAMRFSTVPQVMFFSSLTFYLAASKSDYVKKDLKYIALSAAACIGIKLNGAMILPLVGLIMADRLHWTLNKENLGKALYFALNLLFFTILFSNPSLFLSPFAPKYLFSYLELVQSNSHLSAQTDFLKTLHGTLGVGYFNYLMLLPVLIMLFAGYFYGSKNRRDFIFITLCLIFLMSFLVKTNSMGELYNVNYSMAFMYLSPICFVGFSFVKKDSFRNLLAASFLLLSITLTFNNFLHGYFSPFKYFRLENKPEIIDKIKTSDSMKKLIIDPRKDPNKKINVLMGHLAIFPYSALERSNLVLDFSFDDLLAFSERESWNYDYIVLSKEASYMLEDKEFEALIGKMKDKEIINRQVESKKIADHLLNRGEIRGQKYKILFKNSNIFLLAKEL